ncbi:class I SAM-dependent methyltransferase [Nitrospira sp. CMX1]
MADDKIFVDMQRWHMDNDIHGPDRQRIHESWFRDDTVDSWRHRRMYETCTPLAVRYQGASWLTIGDGRYGLDSVRLRKLFGITSVLPTDIGSCLLEQGKARGLFGEYAVENAEKLTFKDEAFDVVFCKESYHHFPRPTIALYEMLRVSREVVILIEPLEDVTLGYQFSRRDSIRVLIESVRSKLIGQPHPHLADVLPDVVTINPVSHGFEDYGDGTGNYIYGLSIRETEKIVHGLDLGGMAWLGFNDHYVKGCEFEPAVSGNPMFVEVQKAIQHLDEQCQRFPRCQKYEFATVVLFKSVIDPVLRDEMMNAGYRFVRKKTNPVLGAGRAVPGMANQPE